MIEFCNSKEKAINFYNKLGYTPFGEQDNVLIILKDKKLLGCLCYILYKRHTFFHSVEIKKQYRQNGFGVILIEQLIKITPKPLIGTGTKESVKFYEKLGFHIDGISIKFE